MPSDFLTIPSNITSYRLANARVPVCLVRDAAQLKADADGLAPCDIVIDKGRIAAIGPAAPANDGPPSFDLDRSIVLPRLVDVHTHIDKGQIWQRAQNPDGTHMGARMAVMADREANWSRDDVAKRMDFALRCAFVHGTGALRTHIDSYPKQTPVSWPLFAEMRETWKGRIALQAVALYPIDFALNDAANFRVLVETVAKHGGLLGGLTFLGDAPNAKSDAALDKIFEAASANGLDLDFHVDESNSPLARSLRRYRGRSAAPQVQGPHRRRPLLLACARRRQRTRRNHRQGGRGAHRHRLAADVQHVPAGPRGGPHAALAWRRAAA